VLNPVINTQTINTTGGLIAGALVGKQILQLGVVMGVVKRNTVSVIETTAEFLTATDPIDIMDTGATIKDLSFEGGLGIQYTVVEGIELDSTVGGFVGIQVYTLGIVFVASCNVGGYIQLTNADDFFGIYIYTSYVHVSASGTDVLSSARAFMYRSLCKGIDFSFSDFSQFHRILQSSLEDCGPVFNMTGEGYINAYCAETEFLNPVSSAVVLNGNGLCTLEGVTINGSGDSPIKATGMIYLTTIQIPIGAGNAGIGIELLEGAHCSSSNTSIRGAGVADVKVGTLATQTWASVTAAPNFRISDSGVNGDLSTVKRPT
jgi:hypothetical protein